MSEPIKRIIMIGAGGVGFWMATALRRDVPDVELIVYDSDDFEGGFGAQRLPYVGDKKTKKVDFLRGFIRMVMRDSPPLVISQRFEDPKREWVSERESTLIVDCTDMELEARKVMWANCRAWGAQMLRVSYDGNGIVVVARGLPLASKPGGGYSQVPSMAQSLWAGGVGAAAVEKLLRGEAVGDYQMEIPTLRVIKAVTESEMVDLTNQIVNNWREEKSDVQS